MEQRAETATNLAHAIEYLNWGLPVFPVCAPVPNSARCLHHYNCQSPGKVPLVPWKPYQDSLPALSEIADWWEHWPEANIGMATGRLSGVNVIDCDGDTATRAADNNGFDLGPWAWTGRIGGRHLWFAHRDDAPTIFAARNGIDFRGQGGYVLLPPSLHRSGNRYRWGSIYDPAEPLPELPRWINDLAAEGRANGHVLETNGQVDIAALLEHGVPEGQRDDTLIRAAGKCRALDVPYAVALEIVLRIAEQCQPPFPIDQARAKVDYAYRHWQPNPEPSKPIRLNNVPTITDPLTGEVVTRWPEPENRGHAQLSEQGNVEYVEDLLKPGRIVVWAAEEGSGKSYTVDGELAIRMVEAGGKLADTWPVIGQHSVLVLSEMHSDDDYEREQTVLQSLGMERSVLNGRYWRLPLMTAAHGQPCLRVPEWCAWCVDWCKQHNVHLLIADTATGATDVDPWGREIQAVYRQLRSMLDAYPELSIVLIVHCKKPEGHKTERRITDVIGEWGRWCDVIVLQERDGMSRAKLTTFKRVRHMKKIVANQRDGLLVEPTDLSEGSQPKVPLSDVVRTIADNPGITHQRLADQLGVSKRTASGYARQAEEEGLIYQIRGEKGTQQAFSTAQPRNTAQ